MTMEAPQDSMSGAWSIFDQNRAPHKKSRLAVAAGHGENASSEHGMSLALAWRAIRATPGTSAFCVSASPRCTADGSSGMTPLSLTV
jgi:hypothetical protein